MFDASTYLTELKAAAAAAGVDPDSVDLTYREGVGIVSLRIGMSARSTTFRRDPPTIAKAVEILKSWVAVTS